jgi:hypothetical protein
MQKKIEKRRQFYKDQEKRLEIFRKEYESNPTTENWNAYKKVFLRMNLSMSIDVIFNREHNTFLKMAGLIWIKQNHLFYTLLRTRGKLAYLERNAK